MVKKEGKKLRTFNLDERIYNEFSEYCRKHGISMSKKVENFIKGELEKIKIDSKLVKKVEEKIQSEIEKEHPLKRYC